MPHWRVIEATGSSAERRITQPGLSPIAGATQDIGAIEDWLRAHAHFHSAPAQRLLRRLIRTHPTPCRRSLVLRSIVFSPLVSLLGKGSTHHPRLLTSWIIIRQLKFKLFIDFYTHSFVIYIILCLILPCYQSLGH